MSIPEEFDFIICGAGTAGPAVAARLAEDPTLRILLIEAGPDNVNLENTQMVGGWVRPMTLIIQMILTLLLEPEFRH